MLHRLRRWAHHLRLDTRDARRALPPAACDRLAQAVAALERDHAIELRLCLEASLPFSDLWRDAPVRERALALFGQLGVWDTAHNSGVLVYVLLADRAIEIVADRGVSQRLPASAWQVMIAAQRLALQGGGSAEDAFLAAISALREQLPQETATAGLVPAPDNELPDRPHLL
ncbi:TPM domain-containing protein [Amphibiibacter pelophylacis]|uniref:TPM domain-containing protein n=1 Tax=Amphibiibacter pelophylacis TaxID=1799477 RepID=A0ACC6NYI6_9BURK